jgi:predicted LPLAT superfamily acyltransferase
MSSTRADARGAKCASAAAALLAFMIWVTRKLGRTVGRAFLPPIVVYFLVFSGARAASRDYLESACSGGGTLADRYRHYFVRRHAARPGVLPVRPLGLI